MKTVLLSSFVFLSVTTTFAQWIADGIPVGTGSNNQWNCEITAGTIGDSYLAWSDANLSTSNYNAHVSRIRANGSVAWTVVVCNATGNQETPQVARDGMGGVVIAWHDERGGVSNYAVYAQRVDSSGNVLWTANGVQVTNMISSVMTKPRMVSDGASGAFIVFHNQNDVIVQRIDNSGAGLWSASGLNLSAGISSTVQDDAQIDRDQLGGIVVAWENNANINAQRIDGSGVELWGTSGVGVPVCVSTGTQDIPQIVSDGANGAIVAWEDDRVSTTSTGIFAMHVLANGTADIAWTPNGVQVGEAGYDCRMQAPDANGHNNQHVVPDGSGNYYFIYEIYLSASTDYSIFGRRISGVDGSGLAAFTIQAGSTDEAEARAISDGIGKMVVTWDLPDTLTSTIHHIRTVTIDASGARTNDLYVCDGNVIGGGDRTKPILCVSGCFVIYGWHDSRGVGTFDAYSSSSQVLNAPLGAVPASPTLNNPSPVCAGVTGIFNCSVVPGASSYAWTVPIGWTIVSGQGTTALTVTIGANSGNVSVVANNSCGSSAPTTINVIVVNLIVTATSTPASCQTCCDGSGSGMVSGGSAPYTFTWSTIPAQNAPTATALCDGVCYTVTVTSNDGCTASDSTCVSYTIGANEIEQSDIFELSPNPTDGNVTILSRAGIKFNIFIYSIGGECVYKSAGVGVETKLDLSALPGGMYFVRIVMGKATWKEKISIY